MKTLIKYFFKFPKETTVYHIYDGTHRVTDKPVKLELLRAAYGSIRSLEKAGYRIVPSGKIAS